MNKTDKYFKENLKRIMEEGCLDENPRPKYKDGTPAHTKYITHITEEYDLSKGEFPIPTLRNTAIKTGIKEILWIYQKQSNSLKVAREMGINWWDEWNIGDDSVGFRYGYTVAKYKLMDRLLDGLVNDPFGRRHIINLYQYEDLDSSQGLFPCCYETLWSVRKVNGMMYLDLHLVQRSSDYITANFINKTQYVALQMMVASHCGYELGKFSHFVNNLHIYDRHFDAANEILEKETLSTQPTMELKENKSFYDFTVDDFILKGIECITKIKSPLELGI
jgi:thymidylate synthase